MVMLGADGRTLANQVELSSQEDLARVTRAARAEDPSVKAVIRADTAVPHGRVIRVMDVLRRNGVTQLTFSVDGAVNTELPL